MAEQQIRVGDIGTKLELEILEDAVVVDISGAVDPGTKVIHIQKPDGTVISQNAVFTTDGTDGKMYYVTQANDLDLEGTYYIQGYVVLATWTGFSSIGEFLVEENLV